VIRQIRQLKKETITDATRTGAGYAGLKQAAEENEDVTEIQQSGVELVEFNIICHFGDESFQPITWLWY